MFWSCCTGCVLVGTAERVALSGVYLTLGPCGLFRVSCHVPSLPSTVWTSRIAKAVNRVTTIFLREQRLACAMRWLFVKRRGFVAATKTYQTILFPRGPCVNIVYLHFSKASIEKCVLCQSHALCYRLEKVCNFHMQFGKE